MGVIEGRPGMQFAPDDAVVRFGHRCMDQHGTRLGHVALFGQHVRVVAISCFHVWVELDCAFIPLCAFGKLILLVIGIADKKSGTIVFRLELQCLRIVLDGLVEITSSKSRFSGTHGLLHGEIVRDLDCAACWQLSQELRQVLSRRTGIAQIPCAVQKVFGSKTLPGGRLLVREGRGVIDEARRQCHQDCIVFWVCLHQLLQKGQSLQALALAKKVSGLLSFGLVRTIWVCLRDHVGRGGARRKKAENKDENRISSSAKTRRRHSCQTLMLSASYGVVSSILTTTTRPAGAIFATLSLGFNHGPAIKWLKRPGRVVIILRVFGDLGFRQLNWAFHDIPVNDLIADWSCKRSRKPVKATVGGQQVRGIDFYSLDCVLFTRRRDMLPQSLDHRVYLTGYDRDFNNHENSSGEKCTSWIDILGRWPLTAFSPGSRK